MCAVLTLEFASLTAAPRLKAVVSINDSLMTSDPTKLSLAATRFWTIPSCDPQNTLTFRITSSISTMRPAYMWLTKFPCPLQTEIFNFSTYF